VGGGNSVSLHKDAIIEYLKKNDDVAIIHSSSKNASIFKELPNKQFFCLLGNEGYRMEEVLSYHMPKSLICILPPSPRKMGTYIPKNFQGKSYEINNYTFSDITEDSNTSIALQLAIDLGANQIWCIGYDGYSNSYANPRELELFIENDFLFSRIINNTEIKIFSFTKTSYALLENSLYTWI
jgi:4-hydroxy 2-oxovalerate aldolase